MPERWLLHARTDLDAARVLFAERIYPLVCLHAQQCVEKLLKGFLLRKTAGYPKSHDLLELLERAIACDEDLVEWRDTVLVLNQFYTAVRYPDALPGTAMEGLPDREEANVALETALGFFDSVGVHLGNRQDK